MTHATHRLVSRAFTAAAILWAAIAIPTAAQAADNARHDVRSVCPNVEHALQEELSPFWGREQPEGRMEVHFQLDGTRMSEIRVNGDAAVPFVATRRLLHRTVYSLNCKNSSQGSQQFSFFVEFRSPDGVASATVSNSQRVALIEP